MPEARALELSVASEGARRTGRTSASTELRARDWCPSRRDMRKPSRSAGGTVTCPRTVSVALSHLGPRVTQDRRTARPRTGSTWNTRAEARSCARVGTHRGRDMTGLSGSVAASGHRASHYMPLGASSRLHEEARRRTAAWAHESQPRSKLVCK